MEGNALGIPGMALGSVSTWLQAILMIVQIIVIVPLTLWIKGIADRKKASTAARMAEDDLVDRQWDRFERECERLRNQIQELENKVDRFQVELDACRDERDEERRLRLHAEEELIKLQAAVAGRGEGRQLGMVETLIREGVVPVSATARKGK